MSHQALQVKALHMASHLRYYLRNLVRSPRDDRRVPVSASSFTYSSSEKKIWSQGGKKLASKRKNRDLQQSKTIALTGLTKISYCKG
jgi:hypothetical protein